jgi:hypothetical protein
MLSTGGTYASARKSATDRNSAAANLDNGLELQAVEGIDQPFMLSSQGMWRAMEEEIMMHRTKIGIGSASAWVRLAAFGAVAWVICGLATIGSPSDRLSAQSKGAYICTCAWRALREEAYCPLEGLQCGLGHYDLGASELKSGLLVSLQGRSRT